MNSDDFIDVNTDIDIISTALGITDHRYASLEATAIYTYTTQLIYSSLGIDISVDNAGAHDSIDRKLRAYMKRFDEKCCVCSIGVLQFKPTNPMSSWCQICEIDIDRCSRTFQVLDFDIHSDDEHVIRFVDDEDLPVSAVSNTIDSMDCSMTSVKEKSQYLTLYCPLCHLTSKDLLSIQTNSLADNTQENVYKSSEVKQINSFIKYEFDWLDLTSMTDSNIHDKDRIHSLSALHRCLYCNLPLHVMI